MKDVRDNSFSFLDDWYGRLDDIIEDLKNNGFDVLNATNEFIDVSDENDKEYVLKLGGTERTITINKIEALDESLIPITEGGIYPVALYNEADEAFIKVINEILGGNISEVNNLELIPALGFGGGGRYWYRANITLDEDTIVNFITEESTPEAKSLLDIGDLIINPYSDISIECSAHKEQYIDGTTLDALNDSDANMEKLDNESNIIGEAIITKLIESEDKIIEVLKKYEENESDEIEYIDESLIPVEEASHPKLGKRVKSFKGWKIYQGTDDDGDEVFRCFTPDDYRPAVGYEDWETETLEQAISWIENYDLKESKKTVNESNKELARIAFEDILKPFNGTDIKYTDETEDAEFKTHSYVANIISTPQYVELIKKLIDSDKYEYDPDFNDYVKYTEYGQITIIIEDKYITIEVMYNNDEDYFDENLIPINEFNKEIIKEGSEGEFSDSENGTIVVERKTFGDYEKNVFTALDKMKAYISAYEEVNSDTLKALIDNLEDELEVLKDINMKLITGIKQYTL